MRHREQFERTIRQLISSEQAVNSAPMPKKLAHAKRFALEGYYLFGIKAFEYFLECHLLELVSGRVRFKRATANRTYISKPVVRETRKSVLKQLLKSGRSYSDFLPYDRTEVTARIFLKDGIPFTLVDDSQRKTLARCVAVRNYVAHESESARDKFIRQYNSVKNCRIPNPKPHDYLIDTIRDGVSFFQHDMAELVGISRSLCV